MTLGQKQRLFAVAAAELILEIKRRGWECSLGQALRTPEDAAANAAAGSGISNSLHLIKLAIDLNLFIGGAYQTQSEAYLPLGEWWEAHSTAELEYAWGGRFKTRPDGNHFSFAHNGIR